MAVAQGITDLSGTLPHVAEGRRTERLEVLLRTDSEQGLKEAP